MTQLLRAGALFGLPLLVASCGSMDAAHYAPAPNQPVAKLHMEYSAAPGSPRLEAWALNDPSYSGCSVGLPNASILVILGGTPGRQYDAPMSGDVAIGAEKPIQFFVSSGAFGADHFTYCAFRGRFTPAAGVEYRMLYVPAKNGFCHLSLTRRIPGGSDWVKEPFENPAPGCEK